MRDWRGIPAARSVSMKGEIDPRLVRLMFHEIDQYLRDVSRGFGRIQQGEVPDGSGATIPVSPDLIDYLYLPGRSGGQVIRSKNSTDANQPFLTLKSLFNYASPHTQLWYITADDKKVMQVGVDNTALLSAGPALTIGDTTSATDPYLILTANGALTVGGNAATMLEVRRGGALGFVKANSGNNGGLRFYNYQDAGAGFVRTLTMDIGNWTGLGNELRMRYAEGAGSVSVVHLSARQTLASDALIVTTNTSTSGFVYTPVAAFDFLHTTGSTSNPVMVVRGIASQTGDMMQWRNSASTVLAKVDKDGNITATSFIGPLTGNVSTLTTRGDLLTRDASTQVRLAVGASGRFLRSDGTDPSWSTIAETDIVDGAVLARVAADEVVTGSWDFSTAPTVTIPLGLGGVYLGTGLQLYDTLFRAEIQTITGLSANRVWLFPDASGSVVLSGVNSALAGSLTSVFLTSTSTSGASFADTTTNTKRLRFVLSGAVGNNTITITSTAARNYGFQNLSGNIPVVGDDPPAVASGSLGKVDSTAQTAAIASTNLSNTPPAGVYRVCGVLTFTAAGGADRTVDVTIGWTDSRGAQTRTLAAPLSGAATNSVDFDYTLYVASGDISYSTTVAGAAGAAPTYELRIRVVALG